MKITRYLTSSNALISYINTFIAAYYDEIKSHISDCHQILKCAHKLSRKLNQQVQRCLSQRNYHSLIQTIEKYSNTYPMGRVAEQAVTMVKKIIPYCDGKPLDSIMESCELLQVQTHDYPGACLGFFKGGFH